MQKSKSCQKFLRKFQNQFYFWFSSNGFFPKAQPAPKMPRTKHSEACARRLRWVRLISSMTDFLGWSIRSEAHSLLVVADSWSWTMIALIIPSSLASVSLDSVASYGKLEYSAYEFSCYSFTLKMPSDFQVIWWGEFGVWTTFFFRNFVEFRKKAHKFHKTL